MKRHINGYIVEGVDIIDIDLWRKRLRSDRLYYEKREKELTDLIEAIKGKQKALLKKISDIILQEVIKSEILAGHS